MQKGGTEAMKRMILTISGLLVTLVIGSRFLSSGGGLGKADTSARPTGDGTAVAQQQSTGEVVFKVRCYDEGKAALRGMKGILRIETGFHYLHETDTVFFDPKAVTVEEMEEALKKAGTYVETLGKKERN